MCNYRLRRFCRRSVPENIGQSDQRSGGVFSTKVYRRRAGSAEAQKELWRYLLFHDYNFGFSKHYPATKFYSAGSRPGTFTIIRKNLLERLVK